MKLPNETGVDSRYRIRRIRSSLGLLAALLVRYRVWIALASLATLSGVVIALSGPGRSFEFHLSTLVPIVGAVSATAIVAAALIRRVDEWSRHHVGGAWVRDLSVLEQDPPGFTSHLLSADDPDGLRTLCMLAERVYAGTMAAGQGASLPDRLQRRQAAWTRRLKANPDCLAYTKHDDGTLAAVSMIYPLADATYASYVAGELDYSKLTLEQTTANARAEPGPQQLYVAASLGHFPAIRTAAKTKHDLVGRLLVRHLGTVMERIRADPLETRLVVDGLTGSDLKSFRAKEFKPVGAKDRNGCPILELAPFDAGRAAASLIAIADASPRLRAEPD